MARIEKILEKNGKKLIVNDYLPKSWIEQDKEGNDIDEYITIKKLSYDVKNKIKFYSMKTLDNKTQKKLFESMEKNGLSFEDLQKVDTDNKDAVMKFAKDIDLANFQTEEMVTSTLDMEKCILDYGIDPKKHSFKNSKGTKIELDYDSLNEMGNERLIKYLLSEIRTYSRGFELGE
jgi:hypothetical protein